MIQGNIRKLIRREREIINKLKQPGLRFVLGLYLGKLGNCILILGICSVIIIQCDYNIKNPGL
jgi:hypothetical protein